MKRREFIQATSKAAAAVAVETVVGKTGFGKQPEVQIEKRSNAIDPRIEITNVGQEIDQKIQKVLYSIEEKYKNLPENGKPDEGLLLNARDSKKAKSIVSYKETNPKKPGANQDEVSSAKVEAVIVENGDLFIFGYDFFPTGEGAKSGFAAVFEKNNRLFVNQFFEKFGTNDPDYDKKALSTQAYEDKYRTMLVYANEALKLIMTNSQNNPENQSLKELVQRYQKLVISVTKLEVAKGKPLYTK